MRKTLALTAGLGFMALALTGCGGAKPAVETPAPVTVQQTTDAAITAETSCPNLARALVYDRKNVAKGYNVDRAKARIVLITARQATLKCTS